ncbi:Protein MGA2 [Spathaspora sp. JA1]|nr:Protein MGA2 [Spathaspora sp. JA1]
MSSIASDGSHILDNANTAFMTEEQDILDEFLDQRVYDSLGTTTPVSNSENNNESTCKLEQQHGVLMDSLYTAANTNVNRSFTQLNNMDAVSNSKEYLYMDISPNNNFSHIQPKQEESPIFNHHDDSPKSHRSFGESPGLELQPQQQQLPNMTQQLSDFDIVRDELSKLKFGNYFMNPCPKTVDVPDPSYLDFSPEIMSKLPYKLQVDNLPNYSRVETQIKLKVSLSPPPSHLLLHIPQDLISKNKFCLSDSVSNLHPKLKENLLYLDSYVFTSDLSKSCNICPRCIKREQKRASRRKIGQLDENGEQDYSEPISQSISANGMVKNNPNSWSNDKMMKKALIFNCKEIVSFPSPTGLNNDATKSIELSARIICYCRHHKEPDGFKLLFVIKNNNGEVVAKHMTNSIMIMDRKKTSLSIKDSSLPNSIAGSSTNLSGMVEYSNNLKKKTSSDSEGDTTKLSPQDLLQQLSPNSILDESASEVLTNTDVESRAPKRKKLSIDDSLNNSSNPMYNGSINGYSPVSNSDTNTSAVSNMFKPLQHQALLGSQSYANINTTSFSQQQTQQQPQLTPQHSLPSIQRIIPSQGPIRGGIEVTLLGFNFRPGLSVKFGVNSALATHCWSETTIVTYLPPAAMPGQVLVSFEDLDNLIGPHHPHQQPQQVFTYTDDTDRQLIELALQIVGLKMNGKLEDAKNIAKRIVGTDSTSSSNAMNTPTNSSNQQQQLANDAWFSSAHKSLEQLTKSGLSTQEILISLLSLVDLPNCPIVIPNWQLSNKQGQSLLHLATLKNYSKLIRFLMNHGCKIDLQDNQGITPLFLAGMCGHRDLIQAFIECKSNLNLRLSNDKYLKDYVDLNVLDMFMGEEIENQSDEMKKTFSVDSLNSMFDNNYGRHVSKMVLSDDLNDSNKYEYAPQSDIIASVEDYSSEFADSEHESEDDEFEQEEVEEFEDDYEDDYSEEEVFEDRLERETSTPTTLASSEDAALSRTSTGLWQKMMNVFHSDDERGESLPSYDDLFPSGSSSSKPKSSIERLLNRVESQGHDSDVVPSDSSEDMVVSYINHPRKTVENDKMLFFFWLPALMCILGLFFMIYVMDYKIATIEHAKDVIRDIVGNAMVGDERIGKLFKHSDQAIGSI